jgi:hypothetical protein
MVEAPRTTAERSAQLPDVTSTPAPQAESPTQEPSREVVGAARQADEQPDSGAVSDPASGSIPAPIPAPVTIPGAARGPDQNEAAPQRTRPKSSRQPKVQQGRRLPAKQAARDRATPRPTVRAESPAAQAAKPNVYYERDTQLGFAPQLRKRTCNPATGQMPMQCYYPREGRERFPAKAGD